MNNFSENPGSPDYSHEFTDRETLKNHPSPLKSKMRLAVLILLGIGFLAYFIYLIAGLPDMTELENVNPAQATRLYSADGHVIHELFTHSRIWISYEQIPPYVIQGALATEDREFFDHWGVNVKRAIKPFVVNLLTLSFKGGGFSTITMQVARNLYVKKIGFERSIARKLREIITALQIERTYSKKEILEMYLNLSYFGRGAYGIQSAAKKYFNKDAGDLTVEESAFLVGCLKGPNNYQPPYVTEKQRKIKIEGPPQESDESWKFQMWKAVLRRNIVLKNMVTCNYLGQSVYDSVRVWPVITEKFNEHGAIAPYFTEYLRIQLNKLQKELNVNVYEDGLNVYTTLNLAYQAHMDSAIAKRMPAIQERVSKTLLRWKRKNHVPDSVFAKKSVVQIAMVALDHTNGHILAMVGGRNFEKSKFNRATQAKRQPGSTFKPFLYATAIDNGYTPADQLLNQPVVLTNPDGTRWTPENFDHSVGGLTTLREGLKRSLNLISARLILEISPRTVADYARRMGLTTDIRPYPSLAMGSSDVIPLEMVSAFGVFANHGVRVEPVSILRIEDRYGNLLYENKPKRSEVLNRSTAYIITTMLEDVINHGTGGSARWRWHFTAPAAGKTGTTNNYSDAWFMGFTPHLTAGLWVGLDDHTLKLGRAGTGSETALPFWATFMKSIYEDLDIPQDKFLQPPDIVRLNICKDSGKIATNFCPHVIENEVFKRENHPTETCPLHPGPQSNRKRYRVVY